MKGKKGVRTENNWSQLKKLQIFSHSFFCFKFKTWKYRLEVREQLDVAESMQPNKARAPQIINIDWLKSFWGNKILQSNLEMIEQLTDKLGGLHFIHIFFKSDLYSSKQPLSFSTFVLTIQKTTTLTFSHHFLVHLHKALAAGTPEKTGDDMTIVSSFQTSD